MKDQFVDSVVVKNLKASRFDMQMQGFTCFIVYEQLPDNKGVELKNVHIPMELEKTSAKNAIIDKTLIYLQKTGQRVYPFSPEVFEYIKKHPEYKANVARDFNGYQEL
ncbi:hypothetical protein [Myroides sp. LJL119]